MSPRAQRFDTALMVYRERSHLAAVAERSTGIAFDEIAVDAIAAALMMALSPASMPKQEAEQSNRLAARRAKLARELADCIREDPNLGHGSDAVIKLSAPQGEILQTLEWIEERAAPSPKTGRPKRMALDLAVECLAQAFTHVGGRVAIGGGPFTRLLEAFHSRLSEIDPGCADRSPDAFVARAKKYIRARRARPTKHHRSDPPPFRLG